MTAIQIECFLEVARCRSISLAAANMYLSQSSLSRHILALEEELGVSLFLRANNAVRLTPIGSRILPLVEEMRRSYRSAYDQIRDQILNLSGRLHIGVQAGHDLCRPVRLACQHIYRTCPEANLQITHLSEGETYRALMDERIDLLLTLSVALPPSDKLEQKLLAPERMCLAVPADHPNAGLPEISLDGIGQYFSDLKLFLVCEDEFDPPLSKNAPWTKASLNAHIVELSGPAADTDTIMLTVSAGVGMTLIHSTSILAGNPNTRLIPLAPPTPDSDDPRGLFTALYWKKDSANPLLREFLTQLEDQPRN